MKLFRTSGEPGDAKVSRPVRRGAVGKGSHQRHLAGSLPYHRDTGYRHAHVLFFGDRRLDKAQFLEWQQQVREALLRLEKQHAAQQQLQQEAGAGKAQGMEVKPT